MDTPVIKMKTPHEAAKAAVVDAFASCFGKCSPGEAEALLKATLSFCREFKPASILSNRSFLQLKSGVSEGAYVNSRNNFADFPLIELFLSFRTEMMMNSVYDDFTETIEKTIDGWKNILQDGFLSKKDAGRSDILEEILPDYVTSEAFNAGDPFSEVVFFAFFLVSSDVYFDIAAVASSVMRRTDVKPEAPAA